MPACAVCLEEDFATDDLASLPCCTIPQTSTTQFCKSCITAIVRDRGGPANVGRCPNCRAYLTIDQATGELKQTTEHAECALCRQLRLIVERRGPLNICDACSVGIRHRVRYECEGCGLHAAIPHPMWRYQPTPTDFSTETWHCNLRCNSQTRWRVCARDVHRVPADDAPEGWGRREEWLAGVREQRRREGVGREAARLPSLTLRLARHTVQLVLVLALSMLIKPFVTGQTHRSTFFMAVTHYVLNFLWGR